MVDAKFYLGVGGVYKKMIIVTDRNWLFGTQGCSPGDAKTLKLCGSQVALHVTIGFPGCKHVSSIVVKEVRSSVKTFSNKQIYIYSTPRAI